MKSKDQQKDQPGKECFFACITRSKKDSVALPLVASM